MSFDKLLEECLKEPQFEPPTQHTVHGGMYARQLFSPAGTILMGKKHKQDHFFLLAAGVVTMTTDEGPVTISAPYLMPSTAGTRRAIYINEDAIFVTFHRVNSTELSEIENEVVEDDPRSPFGFDNKIRPELLK